MNGFGRRALVSGLFALALLLMLFTEGTHPNTRSLIRLTRISISRPSLALLSTLWFTVCYSLPVNCRWRSGSVENTANTLQHFSSLVHFQYARIFLFIFSSPLFFFWRGGGEFSVSHCFCCWCCCSAGKRTNYKTDDDDGGGGAARKNSTLPI